MEAPLSSNSPALILESGGLSLGSVTETAFLGGSMPTNPLDVSESLPPIFRTTSYGLVCCGPVFPGQGQELVRQPFHLLTSISTITAVSEPSLAALVLVALTASALRRRSRALP
jgi:hypothetical protein